jgi:hypothetical protein
VEGVANLSYRDCQLDWHDSVKNRVQALKTLGFHLVCLLL